MRFMTSSERSELRIPENDDQQDGFVVEDARASMKATVRLAKPSIGEGDNCLLYTSPSPRDRTRSRMPSSA